MLTKVKENKIKIVILVMLVFTLIIGFSYAYWQITRINKRRKCNKFAKYLSNNR